jgi:hypothetical protein
MSLAPVTHPGDSRRDARNGFSTRTGGAKHAPDRVPAGKSGGISATSVIRKEPPSPEDAVVTYLGA